jgi:hypothetical protein
MKRNGRSFKLPFLGRLPFGDHFDSFLDSASPGFGLLRIVDPVDEFLVMGIGYAANVFSTAGSRERAALRSVGIYFFKAARISF